ncbi:MULTISPECIES: thioesterase family protein [Pseudomonas]|uniref:4-hydroxybenzoyl-CoA thioesterase n=2 Tax=Pseudomonadaceae TaxID=135621 RepID=A0A0D0KSS6_9PSED|nr:MULTISPECIES: thioesterase family protein [Pseudomonas]KIQ00035.1 4-hydroxybenzoyl-CoA thioesterase [Pseudomonas fulva]MCW2290160.1 acyl-CoA thioester hydrolase [Pseudomonas sp. BIGb0408]NYH75267.1 acyl-CoA thioester hydrolase [Pseudomonas flavescens]
MLPVTYRTAVQADWVDYNGHLRDAYYLLICSFATDGLMELLGLDEAGRARTAHTLYTLECHLNFLAEVKLGVGVQVRSQLLGHDRKRLHIHHLIERCDDGQTVAESEQMLMNIDTASGRSAPFDEQVARRVAELADSQRDMPRSAYVGRVIGLPVG